MEKVESFKFLSNAKDVNIIKVTNVPLLRWPVISGLCTVYSAVDSNVLVMAI